MGRTRPLLIQLLIGWRLPQLPRSNVMMPPPGPHPAPPVLEAKSRSLSGSSASPPDSSPVDAKVTVVKCPSFGSIDRLYTVMLIPSITNR